MAAAFELHIRVMGLCLFRPDAASGCMDVLMVKPKHHPAHVAAVWYDPQNANQPAGPWVRTPLPQTLDWRSLPVTGGSINSLGNSAPDVSGVVNQPINPVPGVNVNTWLKLPPGKEDFKMTGENWKWLGAHTRLANEVIWKLKFNSSPFLDPTGLLPRLYPVNVGGTIELFMSNVIPADSTYPAPQGSRPLPGTPMAHFDAFYDLYEPPPYTGERPAPTFEPTDMSTQYSCLPAQGK
jgi:hypothetical protein